MSIKKSLIQQAILEAKEIEKFATEKARKTLEEEMAPKIKQITNEALREFENNSINEGMNLEIPAGAELTIKMPEGESTEIENSPSEITGIENEISDDNVDSEDSEETINNEENMSDIFEIEDINEEDAVLPDSGTPVETPNPTPDVLAPDDAAPIDVPETNTMDSLNQKLDDVLAKLDAIASDDSENGEGEGEVTIIDDEPESEITPDETQTPAPAPAPAPEETPIPVQEEEYELDEESFVDTDDEMDEIVYEVEDDNSLEEEMVEYELEEDDDMSEINADSMMEIFNELEELDELEIIDEECEDCEETIKEVRSVGNKKEINESIKKLKAQHGSKVDELNQENESLKQTIKEYKDSFIVLRKQINEVQIFNAKLAYANKLFTNGGLTNDEKMKIAEEFDSVETIEEAKKLYNNFLNEMKVSKSAKIPSIEKLKSVGPAVIKSSNSKTLFESDEMRRMKRLAGIVKNTEE